MSTMTAIYENGVFRPLGTVRLPEHTRVEVELPEVPEGASEDVPLVSAMVTSARGRLVLTPTGIAVNSAKAVREVRDELASRAARK
jgi:predicted DNA-binding antitoxin AbrB/MazE fold protein